MVYIRDGQVVQKRSPWRWTIIADFFLALVSLITVFFQTIFDPQAASQIRSSGGYAGSSNSRKPGGGKGGGGGGRVVSMDNLKADHTARCGGGG